MSLSDETINILFKNTITYLHDIADHVPNNLNVLKSYYATKFRISQLKTNISLQKSKYKFDARCPKCSLKLRETGASYSLKPQSKKSKFAKKLLKKVETEKRLSRYQAKYLKINNVNAENKLVVICNFCKKETSHHFEKPIKKRRHANEVHLTQKKKKPKKKDKFSGLNQDAVISVQIHNGNEKNRILNNQISKRKITVQQKKNKAKLNNLLKQNTKTKSGSVLNKFLQFLNK